MENFTPVITLKRLKDTISKLEKEHQLSPETKIFLDTGWDSVQEVAPDALEVGEVKVFSIEDPLTKERFGGYVLKENAKKMNAVGKPEKVLLIRNLY